jgi:hypothetical protein
MAVFKVRRDALFMKSASVKGSFLADTGFNTTSGSVSTFSGGLTAASTFTVTGSAIIGSGGTAIAGMLAGSTAGCPADIAASAVGAASYAVTGLTTAHKLFVTGASMTSGLVLQNVVVAAGSFTANYGNVLSTDTTAACTVVYYLAVLDK